MQLRANARKAGQEYIDKAFMRGRFPSALPRTLTARNGHLTPQQQYVYDDFARIPRTAPKEGEPLVLPALHVSGNLGRPIHLCFCVMSHMADSASVTVHGRNAAGYLHAPNLATSVKCSHVIND